MMQMHYFLKIFDRKGLCRRREQLYLTGDKRSDARAGVAVVVRCSQ